MYEMHNTSNIYIHYTTYTTLHVLAFCFKLTVKILKNILCNGFKTNVNKMN